MKILLKCYLFLMTDNLIFGWGNSVILDFIEDDYSDLFYEEKEIVYKYRFKPSINIFIKQHFLEEEGYLALFIKTDNFFINQVNKMFDWIDYSIIDNIVLEDNKDLINKLKLTDFINKNKINDELLFLNIFDNDEFFIKKNKNLLKELIIKNYNVKPDKSPFNKGLISNNNYFIVEINLKKLKLFLYSQNLSKKFIKEKTDILYDIFRNAIIYI